jgi:sensor c-di-GMP phosphodiesterase-like protein
VSPRELLFLPTAFLLSATVVAAYLWMFHQSVSLKETLSTATAMTFGVLVGRAWERRTGRG